MIDDPGKSAPSAKAGTAASASALTGLTWVLCVLAAYYFFNAGYYREKLSVFFNFLVRMAGH